MKLLAITYFNLLTMVKNEWYFSKVMIYKYIDSNI